MLLWIEGFNNFGTTIGNAPSPTGVVARKYSTITGESNIKIRAGRLDGYSFEIRSSETMGPGGLTTNATMIVGMAVRFQSLAAGTFLQLYDGSTLGMNLRLTAAGELAVYRGTTLLETTAGLGLLIDTWYYIEFKVLCDNTTGTYEVRVSGIDVASDTGVDTQAGSNAYHTTFRLIGTTSLAATTCWFDDVYCCDGSGTANNDFLGNMRVETIRPNGAGNSTDWTPDSGDNYSRVDEEICDDDTSYVEDSVSAEKDLYAYGNLAAITTSIKGIMINSDCRETDANSFSLKTVCLSNVTESADAGQAIGTTDYITKSRILETDPDTTNAWTVNGVNAAQFGIEIV